MRKKKKKIIEANAIYLSDENGKHRIVLDAGAENRPAYIAMFSRSGKRYLNVITQDDDSIEITLRGECGRSYVQIQMSEHNQGSIWLSDEKGLPEIILGRNQLAPNRHNKIIILDEGNIINRIPNPSE